MEEEWKVEDKKTLMDIASVAPTRKAKCQWCARITNYPKEKNGKVICPDCLGRYFTEEKTGYMGSYYRGD